MGLAIDTIGSFITNTAAGGACTAAPGDSFTVRSFNSPAKARLDGITRRGSTAGFARVRSPLFHDDVQGIRVYSQETPTVFEMPPALGQNLTSQDTLIVEASSGAADSTIVGLHVYYENVGGTTARLHSPGDIVGNVKSIKPVQVVVAASATVGTWSDTLFTTTEDLTHANTDYAVLGFLTSVPLALVGIRGQETGNLRIAGPGSTLAEDTANYWYKLSEAHGVPYIPVVNAANKGSIYVSVMDNAASTAATITLIMAELMTNLPT